MTTTASMPPGTSSSTGTRTERQALRDDVPRLGFKARIRDRYLFEIAKECLALSHAGLRRRGRVDHLGRDETRHLEPLERIIDSGRTPAEEMLEKFHGPWHGSVEPAYDGIRVLDRKPASHLDRGVVPVRVKQTRQNKRFEPGFWAVHPPYRFVAIKWRP